MVPQQGYVSVSRRPPDIEDYIDILRRYRSWIVGPTFAGLVIAVVVAFLWPDTFVSTAVMRITPQQISERLVPSNISTQMAERLLSMQQQIESRTSLQELIQRQSLNLYTKERQRKPMEDVIEQMRKAIKITLLDSGSTGGPQQRFASAFAISFSYSDRYKAQAVVGALVSKFTEETHNQLRQQADTTTTFLNDQLKSAKETLDRLDGEMTKFKMENAGRLPDQLQANLQAGNALEMQLQSINEALNRDAQDKMMLETQLQNLQHQSAFIGQNLEQNSSRESVKNDHLIQLNNKIMDLDSQLSALRQTYREDHPDIRKAEAQLTVMKKQRDDLEKEETTQAAKTGSPKKVTNPQVAQSMETLKLSMSNVQAQIQARNMEMEQRARRQKELQAEITVYRARVDASPVNEQRYLALQRDYQLAKADYDEKSKKKEISETSSDLEERKAGENLETLDPPSLPEQAAEPNRLLIAGAGIGVGIFFGVFMAGIREMKDTSLKNLKDVRAYTNLPVLSSIPLLENALLVRRKRRLFWLAWSTAVIVGTIAISSSMYYYYFGKS
jgi:polysaccharide chain length determinant protein (PEP-CTERM system associated)